MSDLDVGTLWHITTMQLIWVTMETRVDVDTEIEAVCGRRMVPFHRLRMFTSLVFVKAEVLTTQVFLILTGSGGIVAR